jgi:hypothetical protein
MKHKKLISLFSFALITSLGTWYFLKANKKTHIVKEQNQSEVVKKNESALSKNAQVPKAKKVQQDKVTNTPKKNSQRRTISSTKSARKDLLITNKYNPDWQKRYLKSIQRSFFDEKVKIDIKHLRSLVHVKYNKGRLAEKVKVKITRENGRTTSYTALVDAQTGSLINSWNPTRYEFKEKLTLDARGTEFAP